MVSNDVRASRRFNDIMKPSTNVADLLSVNGYILHPINMISPQSWRVVNVDHPVAGLWCRHAKFSPDACSRTGDKHRRNQCQRRDTNRLFCSHPLPPILHSQQIAQCNGIAYSRMQKLSWAPSPRPWGEDRWIAWQVAVVSRHPRRLQEFSRKYSILFLLEHRRRQAGGSLNISKAAFRTPLIWTNPIRSYPQ